MVRTRIDILFEAAGNQYACREARVRMYDADDEPIAPLWLPDKKHQLAR
jgi:hypothetical protein